MNDIIKQITLTLDDDEEVLCDVLEIFSITINGEERTYIALLPVEDSEDEDSETWFYRFIRNENEFDLEDIEDFIEFDIVSGTFYGEYDEVFDEEEYDEVFDGEFGGKEDDAEEQNELSSVARDELYAWAKCAASGGRIMYIVKCPLCSNDVNKYSDSTDLLWLKCGICGYKFLDDDYNARLGGF